MSGKHCLSPLEPGSKHGGMLFMMQCCPCRHDRLINDNDDNNSTVPVRGLGVYLDHLVSSACPGSPICGQ
jgi:hypothetical protein